MRKFTTYIKEAEEYTNLQKELTEMIKASLNSNDAEVFNKFLSAYKENPEGNQIEGLINSADVYDFYLKYQDDIDNVLYENKFFEETPISLNVMSLYEYVVEGTKKAIILVINKINYVQFM